jgi:ornithine cyclodeaminase/alanine dehydrogenase-like protein (mu-crystallin family)
MLARETLEQVDAIVHAHAGPPVVARAGARRECGPAGAVHKCAETRGQPVWDPSDMLVLSAADVERLFTLDVAIESQRAAFTALGRGTAVLPPRLLVPGVRESVAFCYAARLSPDGAPVSKFGSVNPANSARGLPSVNAVITVLHAETGQPVAVMDGTSVTTIRTSAASAVAASVLARTGARTLAVLGSGVQAKAHVAALSRVLDLEEVRIWSPSVQRREALALSLTLPAGSAGPAAARAATSAENAVRGADVIACCTSSFTPVLDVSWLAEGATVISIGSFAPDRHEVPAELAARADAVVVDDVSTALEDAGPIMAAAASDEGFAERLIPLGGVVAGLRTARHSDAGLVYYNSVGLGVQDAAAALAIVSAASMETR